MAPDENLEKNFSLVMLVYKDLVSGFRATFFDMKQFNFVGYIKKYINNLTPKLDAEKQEDLKKNIKGATKFLLSKLSDLQFFVGESMVDDVSTLQEWATDPPFM
ncbi:hypothetical protein RND71_035562 [Anisodus tanguticus]|uniref:TCTP domain-containing protein n=1 Tax=Anisodus tanguticus TaxID=243964 RepID=A0AAE1UZV8_9SOLA|nr:hypothetical protein RND71_035562 [Anisodus tanguticus]